MPVVLMVAVGFGAAARPEAAIDDLVFCSFSRPFLDHLRRLQQKPEQRYSSSCDGTACAWFAWFLPNRIHIQ
jgi:hypothetical protein